MRLSVLGLLAIVLFAFSSCSKSESKIDDLSSDAQLIEAIQKAGDKQVISTSKLPSSTQALIAEEYLEDYIDVAKLAPKLGYEVDMRGEKGPRVGEFSQAYFDLKGRRLNDDKGDRPPKGNGNDDKGDGHKGSCFEFVLPVTFEMPDGSEITIEEKEDWELIKNWYQANPDVKEKPALEFPVDVVFKDGTTLTLGSEEDLREAMVECKGNDDKGDKGKCFELVLPVTYTMPDGTEITIEKKEDKALIKAWYEAHPDVNEKPALQFPVDIKYGDGSVKTISSVEEMKEAKADCKGDKGDGHGKKCFRLVLPVTYTMPDGTEITVNEKEDFMLLKNWYQENPGYDERPQLQFPVEIKYKDGTVLTINSEEEMKTAKEECGDKEDGKKRCFMLVFPVIYTMEDGSEITIEDKEDHMTMWQWYAEHPDVKKPSLQFPVEIEYKDGTLVTINNKEEMMQARKDCKGNGKG